MLHKIVCQQRQSQSSVGELEASEMFAMIQISQRAHESSNKTVSGSRARDTSHNSTPVTICNLCNSQETAAMLQPLFAGNVSHRMQIRRLKVRQNYITAHL